MQTQRDNFFALTMAVLLHVAVAALLIVGISNRKDSPIIAQNVIQATLVDPDDVRSATLPVPEEPLPEPEVVEEPPEEPPEEPEPDPEIERQREEALEREREEILEREREAAEEKERERIAEVERLRLQQEKKLEQQREEQQRKEREEKEREAELEKQRQADAARKKKEEEARVREAERKKKLEEDRKAAAKRAREAQEARRREEAENELQNMLAEEERRRDAVAAGLEDQYKLKIKQRIERNWNPPPVTGAVSCELRVRQFRTGDLATIERVDCGGNSALERSLEAAANKASPFPTPDDPSLFDPLLVFKFSTDE